MSLSEENRDNNGGEANQSSFGKSGGAKLKMAHWLEFEKFTAVKGSPSAFEQWLINLERRATFYTYSDSQKLHILYQLLDDGSRYLLGDGIVFSEAKEVLNKAYGPTRQSSTTAMSALLNISQLPNENITAYFIKFRKYCDAVTRLGAKLPAIDDIFYDGLQRDHKKILGQRGDLTVEELVEHCRRYESDGLVSLPQVRYRGDQEHPVFAARAQNQQEQQYQGLLRLKAKQFCGLVATAKTAYDCLNYSSQ